MMMLCCAMERLVLCISDPMFGLFVTLAVRLLKTHFFTGCSWFCCSTSLYQPWNSAFTLMWYRLWRGTYCSRLLKFVCGTFYWKGSRNCCWSATCTHCMCMKAPDRAEYLVRSSSRTFESLGSKSRKSRDLLQVATTTSNWNGQVSERLYLSSTRRRTNYDNTYASWRAVLRSSWMGFPALDHPRHPIPFPPKSTSCKELTILDSATTAMAMHIQC
jgi:hypothetical protein